MLGKTMGEIFDYACHHFAPRTAIVFGGRRYRFSDLKAGSTKLANALLEMGVRRGDRAAILMPNCPEIIFVYYALFRLGVAVTPLAAYLKAEDMTFMLNETRAATLIYHESFSDRADQVRSGAAHLKRLICSAGDPDAVPSGRYHLQALMENGPDREVPVRPELDDIMFIGYTGGTTGLPKGVVHSHRTFVASTAVQLIDFDIGREEVFLAATPLTHAAFTLLPCFYAKGGCCVIMQGFDPTRFLQIVEKERVTTTFLVPTMIYLLLDHPDRGKYDTSSLRNIIYGAAPMAPERVREGIQAFGRIFTQLYGQTEAPNALAALPREEHLVEGDEKVVARLASCGRPTLATKIKLLDDQGMEVPPGEPGEVVAWSPMNMVGYLDRPELTAETLRDGWLHTGDIARMDEQGYIFIVDRKKDMIISGGFNIYPKEVEDALHEHPAVANVIVIGVPDPKWGEAVKAVVQLKAGQAAAEEELIAFCKERKGSVMAPKSVDFVESVPLTPLGKPDRKAVREKYWEGKARRV